MSHSSTFYLVEGREDVVSKLNLCNGVGSSHGETDGEASYPLLTEGGVEDSLLAVLLCQTDRATEHSTKGHVLSKYTGGVIGGQGDVQTVSDGLEQRHLLCLSCVTLHHPVTGECSDITHARIRDGGDECKVSIPGRRVTGDMFTIQQGESPPDTGSGSHQTALYEIGCSL